MRTLSMFFRMGEADCPECGWHVSRCECAGIPTTRPVVVDRYCGTCTRCKERPGSARTTPSTATGTVLKGCVCDDCWLEFEA